MHPEISTIIPYAVNSAIVVVLLFVLARKPAKKFVYQRHERLKDSIESAAVVHQRALDRAKAARARAAELASDQEALFKEEAQRSKEDAAALLASLKADAKRIETDTDRLLGLEQEESDSRIKKAFIDMVVTTAEGSLKRDLKTSDHSAIVNRAKSSIEVGA